MQDEAAAELVIMGGTVNFISKAFTKQELADD
jgi:hypothetical protein